MNVTDDMIPWAKKNFSQIYSQTPFHRRICNLLFHYLTHFDSILTYLVFQQSQNFCEKKRPKKKFTPVKNANEMYRFLILLSWFCHVDCKVPHHQNYYRTCNARCALHIKMITFPFVEKISQRSFTTENRATDLVSAPDEKGPCYHPLIKPEYERSIIYISVPVLGF